MTPPPAVPAADGTAAAGAAALLAHRPWRRWVPTSALSRVPMAMAPLAVLLLGEHATGSLTSGVFLAGVFSLFSGAPGPFVGRLLDRFEMRRGLLWSLVAAAGSTILLLATAALGAPLWLYVLLCALQGLSMAGLLGGMRALLLVVAPPGNLRRAHFAESLMVELSAVLGPLLVGALALLGGADAALAGTALLCAAAGWAMRSAPALPPAPAAAATPLLPAVPVLRISLLVLCVSTGYGVLTANIPQRMADYGLTSTHATWVTAVFSTGACLGGVLASLRPLSADRAAAGTPLLLLASAAISLPAGLAQTVGGYAAALFASALLLVPLNGILVTRVEAELGLRRRAEGFSYFGAAATAGGSLGYLAASALAPLTTADRIAFLAPALHLALAGVLGAALISRGTPRARSTATEPTEGVSVSTLPSAPSPTESTSPRDEESRLRRELAAVYRLVAHFRMTDLVFTHISVRLPGPDHHFLINPYGLLFEEITASSLVRIDLEGRPVEPTPHPVNPAGFVIHSAVHAARADAHCVLHTHTRAGCAVAALEEGLLPVNQMSLEFHGRVGYHDYEGIALNLDEQRRLVADLGDHPALVLRNHGLLTVGRTPAEAFLRMYYLERACQIQVTAQAAGRLRLPSEEVCAYTARQFSGEAASDLTDDNGSELAWRALLRLLDRIAPDYGD